MIAAATATLSPSTPDLGAPDRRAHLRDRCMRELSKLDRLIIVLYYYEQLTTPEVAAVLELPEDQIETRRATLARRLGAIATVA